MNSSVLFLLIFIVMAPAQSAPVPKPSTTSKSGLEDNFDDDELDKDDKSEIDLNENGTEIELNVFTQIAHGNQAFKMPLREADIIQFRGRSALNCEGCFWKKSENGLVIVPYIISKKYTPTQVSLFMNAVEEMESVTCVRFVQRTNEDSYINIVATGGCASFIGKTGGAQDVYLNPSTCMTRGTIQHEIKHSLGFVHEHSRSDRDLHVTIMYQYIPPESLSNFEKEDTNNMNLEYDYFSVMHYPCYAFSSTPGECTIIPKPDPSVPIGQRNGISTMDVAKINALYHCDICATLLPDANGTVTSANYPATYPNNSNCVFLIRVPSGQISLKFNVFDIEASEGCFADYFQIYDGHSKKSPVLVDRTCGATLIPLMISTSNQVLIEFVTNNVVTGKGFNITYDSVQCGGAFYAPTKHFTSPGYPNKYSTNMKCKWIITCPPENQISLKISDFQLEGMFNKKCFYDYLSVYNGPDAASPLLGKFCGTRYTSPIKSTGNTMYIEFLSDKSNVFKGFQAIYTFAISTML
uniref:Metalloendopeptidase n=1 Tax=Leptobrachium leishanense TaxID=445787 RepID=A0A8C5QEG6_9ANUR